MSNWKHKILPICLIFTLITGLLPAFDAGTHDRILFDILIGKNENISVKGRERLNALNSASYLAIDYFNGSSAGDTALKNLKKAGVKYLPRNLDRINYTSNSRHQFYTHRGWNRIYPQGENKANWLVRKKILINTSKCVFKDCPKMPDSKKEAFAAIVYYIHILGDHCGDSYKTRGYRLPMTSEPEYLNNRSGDKELNPTVYTELIYYIGIFLSEHKRHGSMDYNLLMRQLNSNKDYFKKASEETIKKNNQKFAARTIKILEKYLPKLLVKNEYFHRAFY